MDHFEVFQEKFITVWISIFIPDKFQKSNNVEFSYSFRNVTDKRYKSIPNKILMLYFRLQRNYVQYWFVFAKEIFPWNLQIWFCHHCKKIIIRRRIIQVENHLARKLLIKKTMMNIWGDNVMIENVVSKLK